MKSYRSLNSALLMSTMCLSPSLAFAQQPSDTPIEQPAIDIPVDEIVVRGRFIPNSQRATAQVATFLNAEDLARTGDDNAALALTRLSGVSIVSGRFAYVRGLGDRYSAARLNGSPLPSPEPLRRTVPLDLFPSNILDGAVVQKTYSPDYPGEFGGGIIDLFTIGRPDESFANVKFETGMNLETTASNGIFVNGGDLDWLGYDDGLRSMPAPLSTLLETATPLNSLPSAEIEAAGESLVNSPLSVIQQGTLGPNFETAIDGGATFAAGDFDIGFVGVAGYKQTWTTERAVRQFVSGNVLGNDIETFETTLDVTVNALASGSLAWGDDEIKATALYIHSTSKEAQIDTGIDFNRQGSTGEIFDESSGWFERDLAMAQLSGSHIAGDFEFNWRGALAQSTRNAPYERTLNRQVDANGAPLYSVANSYNIRFSDLKDRLLSGGADIQYTVPLSGPREAVFRAGYEYSNTERDYDFLGLRFAGGNSLPADVQAARPDFLFSPDNIDPARFVLQEIVTPNDSYDAELEVHAGFAMAELEVIPTVRTTLGVRYEDGVQTVNTFDRFGNPGSGAVDLNNSYWLPSVTLTWNFAEDMQLRAGYSHTIARPQFRELAQSNYFDPESERSYRGNRGLIDSELRNYDARFEYYLGRNQFVTLAGFYKKIENPIEEIQFETSTFEFETTFINSPQATIYGGEFEYRTRFAFPFSGGFFGEREGLFSVNYTYTLSDVQADAGDLIFNPIANAFQDATLFGIDGSALQGAPKHIANAQFGWEGERDQLTLLVGWVGDRVLQRGFSSVGSTLPDVVERPGIQLDLVFRQDVVMLGGDFTIGITGRNLLAEAHEEFQISGLGRTEFNTYDRGRSLSASLTAKF